jgi:hypothetical protein
MPGYETEYRYHGRKLIELAASFVGISVGFVPTRSATFPSGSKGEKAVINWNEINLTVITVIIELIGQQDFS